MKQCLDEGILQSFCDGELAEVEAQNVTTHVTRCSTCAAALSNLTRVNDLVAVALAPEFQASVPTERLRLRIDAAIAAQQVGHSEEKKSWFSSLANFFSFTRPQAFGFASLLAIVVFATVFAIVYWRRSPTPSVSPDKQLAVVTPNVQPVSESSPSPELQRTGAGERVTSGSTAKYVRHSTAAKASLPAVARVKLLPGEKSYLKTIAKLDSTIKSANNRPMRPALRAEYERNLALVDQALAAARTAAKKSPNDPDAAEFVFAAYQSKVDLLNTVADARIPNHQQ